MSILSKAIYRLNAIPTKITMTIFAKIEKPILKFKWTLKHPRIAKNNREKEKKKAGRLTLPYFKTYYSKQNSVICDTALKTDRDQCNKEPRNKSSHIWSNNF